MDKCVIKSNSERGDCVNVIRVPVGVCRQIRALGEKTNRSISSVAGELLTFALERVEIEYPSFANGVSEPDEGESEGEDE
jgi:hypothetical protein